MTGVTFHPAHSHAGHSRRFTTRLGLEHPQKDGEKLGCSEAPSEALIMLDPKGSPGHPHYASSLGTLAKQQLQVMVSVL